MQCIYTPYTSSVGVENSAACRNYDLTLDLDYRNLDGYKNGDVGEEGNAVHVTYKSKNRLCRANAFIGLEVADTDITCTLEQSTKILFEVYRREIIPFFSTLVAILL